MIHPMLDVFLVSFLRFILNPIQKDPLRNTFAVPKTPRILQYSPVFAAAGRYLTGDYAKSRYDAHKDHACRSKSPVACGERATIQESFLDEI